MAPILSFSVKRGENLDEKLRLREISQINRGTCTCWPCWPEARPKCRQVSLPSNKVDRQAQPPRRRSPTSALRRLPFVSSNTECSARCSSAPPTPPSAVFVQATARQPAAAAVVVVVETPPRHPARSVLSIKHQRALLRRLQQQQQ